MKEPEKIPLDPETPRPNEVKKIPMPSLYPEKMQDDAYSSNDNKENDFWKFIAKHQESRKEWKKSTNNT